MGCSYDGHKVRRAREIFIREEVKENNDSDYIRLPSVHFGDTLSAWEVSFSLFTLYFAFYLTIFFGVNLPETDRRGGSRSSRQYLQ